MWLSRATELGEERIGNVGLADANYYIQDGLRTRSYGTAQETVFSSQ